MGVCQSLLYLLVGTYVRGVASESPVGTVTCVVGKWRGRVLAPGVVELPQA
jgi:hypothetical protein